MVVTGAPPGVLSRRGAWATALLLVLPSLPVLWICADSLIGDARGSSASAAGLSRALLPLELHLAFFALALAIAGRLSRLGPLLLPAIALMPAELFYLVRFGSPSDANVYGIIAETHLDEAISWMGPLLWIAPLATAISLVLGAWALRTTDWRWRHRSRWWVLAGALLAAAGWWVADRITQVDLGPDVEAEAPELPVVASGEQAGLRDLVAASYPWGLPLRAAEYLRFREALRAHHHPITDLQARRAIAAASGSQRREIHLLVIGESSRPDRWSLYGAARDTTPQLRQRRDLIVVRDAVSAATATRQAVPLMLSYRPPGQPLRLLNTPSLFAPFKQVGFRTYWLSTQGENGRNETPVTAIARDADEAHFLNPADFASAGTRDDALLPVLREILARPEPRQFIVLHTLGSHLHYAHRYTDSFARFQPALPRSVNTNVWSDAHASEMINAYDNSLLFTDRLLDDLIGQVAALDASATLLFVSDHGETLYDGDCGRAGHGFRAESNYRIPMFVWAAPAWRNAHVDRMARLAANARRPVTALSIFATELGLADIDVSPSVRAGDLGDANYSAPPRLTLRYGDFDRELAGRTCSTAARKAH